MGSTCSRGRAHLLLLLRVGTLAALGWLTFALPREPRPEPLDLSEGLAELRGRVMAEGQPVVGALVRSRKSFGPGVLLSNDGVPWIGLPTVAEARTGSDGRFVLMVPKEGFHVVHAEAPRWAPAGAGPFEATPRHLRAELLLELHAAGGIEGRVRMPAGASPAGVLVSASCGSLEPVAQRTDAEGRYRFESLGPGRWHVERREEHEGLVSISFLRRGRDPMPEWNCEVRAGEVTRFDLDLRDERPRAVAGRLTVDGAPARGWHAELFSPYRAEAIGTTTLDDQGRFRLLSPRAGIVRCVLRPSPVATHGFWQLLDLREEVTPWELETVSGRIAGSRPDSPVWLHQESKEGNGGFHATIDPAVGTDEEFHLDLAPRGLVTVFGTNRTSDPEIRVRRGRTTRLDLR